IRMNRALAGEDPQEPTYRRNLALGLYNLAVLKRGDEALKLGQEALQLQDALARRSPGIALNQERLVIVCEFLGKRQLARGDLRSAERTLQRGLDAAALLTEGWPGDDRYRTLLADARRDLGGAYRGAGRQAEAEKESRAALSIFQELAGRNKADDKAAHQLAWAHNLLGVLYRHMGRPADAEKQHRQALAVREGLWKKDKNNPEYAAN